MHLTRFASFLMMMLGGIWHGLTATKLLSGAVVEWRWTMKRARQGAALVTDPWTHYRVTKALSRREIRPVLDTAPLMMFKYLTEYLKTGLSRKDRASILVRHYTVLGDRAQEQFFKTIVGGGVRVWQETFEDELYSIVLTFPRETHEEGDLALVFHAGTIGLYTLSFTIGPGSIANLGVKDVMYIARVQGKGKSLDRIRTATRACGDISPAALLLAAAEGIAMELNLERIVGISADDQISHALSGPEGLYSAYDEFWLALGAEKLASDMYQLAVPLVEKPIQAIKRCHRSRVRRKRAFKATLRDQVRAAFRESVMRAPANPGLLPS